MKKMFLALALLVVAPSFVAAEEASVVTSKSYLAQAKDKVANAGNYLYTKAVAVSDSVENAGSKIPGSSSVSKYVLAPSKNWHKVSMIVVAAITAAVVSSLENNSEAEF